MPQRRGVPVTTPTGPRPQRRGAPSKTPTAFQATTTGSIQKVRHRTRPQTLVHSCAVIRILNHVQLHPVLLGYSLRIGRFGCRCERFATVVFVLQPLA